MDHFDIQASVLSVLEAVLKCPVGPDSSRANTPVWDSLKHIEIVFAVEEELGIEFSEEDMAKLNSVARIVDLAAARHAA